MKIFIDRLRDDHEEKISEKVDPSFLEINEKELSFPAPISVEGEAYLADNHLILRLSAQTEATLPCSICNHSVSIPIHFREAYHSEQLDTLRTPIFDYAPLVREELLLQVPAFVECSNGNCPERKFLKNNSTLPQEDELRYPFAHLE